MARPSRFAVLTLGLVVAITACSNARSHTVGESGDHPEVVLFGDSLAWEAQAYFTSLVRASGATPLAYTARGSAICDWIPKMRAVEAQVHPEAVELEFSGNALTPCMRGYNPPSSSYFEKYRSDTLTAINLFVSGGARVLLVGAPINRDDTTVPDWDRLNGDYASIAANDPGHVTYVDAGASVEGAGHVFTDTLPCLSGEPCTGPIVNGVPSNVVRAPDGGHFCPVEKDPRLGIIGPCPVYSSGAYRYASAMAHALLAALPYSHSRPSTGV